MLAALIGLLTVEVARDAPAERPKHLLHRAAIPPGSVLFLGLISLAGFTAFVPLYVHDVDVSAGVIFAIYGVFILAVRVLGARVPDQLGGRLTASLALVLIVIGSFGRWRRGRRSLGLVVGTVVFAAGMSLMYPALLLLALARRPRSPSAPRWSARSRRSSTRRKGSARSSAASRSRLPGATVPHSPRVRCARSPGWSCCGHAGGAMRTVPAAA